MVVAAFILSIAAMLVAAASAWYTRRQAVSTEAVRRIEDGRRHDELCPQLSLRFIDQSQTREQLRPAVRLTNNGPLDLQRVELTAIPPHRLKEAVIAGIYDHQTGGTATMHETGALPRAASWEFDILPLTDADGAGTDVQRGGVAAFRCTCYAAAHEPWVVIAQAEIPQDFWII